MMQFIATNAVGLTLLVAMIATSQLAGCGTDGKVAGAPPLQSVPQLDLNRYAGRWYEIARYPASFQKGMVGVTADYTLLDDGEVQVINAGREGSLDGPRETAEAVAWRPDERHPARLKVQFFWPFVADYWVIGLDEQYEWAIVGEPDRRYLWLLSRTPTLPDDTVQTMLDTVAAQGYKTEPLTWTPQSSRDRP